jgi:uncharacterized protein
MTDGPRMRLNAAQHRYELWLGDERIGLIGYQGPDELRHFLHTEVDPAHGGRGYGSLLIRAALDEVRSRGAELVPSCPFVRAYLQKHPDDVDLVPPGRRAGFGLPKGAD